MVGRLLWKEFREGWLVVLIAVALPPATLRLSMRMPFPMSSDATDLIRYSGVIGSYAALMLWAIRKGSRRRDEGKTPLAHVPVNPIFEKAISILIPLAISALIGVWVGAHVPIEGRSGGYVPKSPVVAAMLLRETQETAMRFSSLYASSAVAGCYLMSAAISAWAGLLAGFVWTIVGLSWVTTLQQMSFDARHYWMAFVSRTAAGAVLCLALFILPRGRQLRASRIIAVALLAAIMFGPMAYDQFIAPDQSAYYGDIVYSADRSLVLDSSVENAIGSKHTEKIVASTSVVSLTDRRTGRSVTRDFRGAVYLIGFDNAGYAYLVRQGIGSSRAGIIRWKGRSATLLATIPAAKGTVLRSTSWPGSGSISPDRRYLAFRLRCGLGDGMDVWIVNLRTGVGWVAFPNGWTDLGLARWLGSRLVLPGYYGISTVDLVTRRTGTLSIPGQDGG